MAHLVKSKQTKTSVLQCSKLHVLKIDNLHIICFFLSFFKKYINDLNGSAGALMIQLLRTELVPIY